MIKNPTRKKTIECKRVAQPDLNYNDKMSTGMPASHVVYMLFAKSDARLTRFAKCAPKFKARLNHSLCRDGKSSVSLSPKQLLILN